MLLFKFQSDPKYIKCAILEAKNDRKLNGKSNFVPGLSINIFSIEVEISFKLSILEPMENSPKKCANYN